MNVELVVAIAGAIGVIASAIAYVVKKWDPMEWWRGRRAEADRRAERDQDNAAWTRSQLEHAHGQLRAEAEQHKAAQERLRSTLETRIANLESSIANVTADLSQAHIYNARLMSDVQARDQRIADLERQRDDLIAELKDTRATYAKIIAEAFARRVAEEER